MDIYGECENCGKEADLICVGDTYLCEECVEGSFLLCDKCGEYYPPDLCYRLNGESIVCDDCASKMLDNGEVDEDELEEIEEDE